MDIMNIEIERITEQYISYLEDNTKEKYTKYTTLGLSLIHI